ncbi:putative membrane protein [Beauveria bassiana D1-5]|uniref:Putative membrane protein n=1 Tax=Beauveria bassiana D1-5 TaxID=1245745 RepID=A0A0A2VR61_BEABA|nr:putative membrane protein [Beauveria bassiana D1-5]
MEQPSAYSIAQTLAGDVAAAFLSAALVAPFVAAIDRSVTEKAISHKPILVTLRKQAKEWPRHPRRLFSSPVHIVWLLYAATYTAANTSETVMKRFGASWPVEPFKVAATLLVNVPLGIWKDVRFAHIFGVATNKTALASHPPVVRARRLPTQAAVVFLVRDGLTIFGGFCLPNSLTGAIAGQHRSLSTTTQIVLAQLMAPPLVQIVATPIHLHGVGLCAGTRNIRQPFNARAILPATVARCLRVIPAYSVGCLANTEFRRVYGSLHWAAKENI